jgi:predicted transposase/invertase (TIGR01784 family)
MKVIYIFLEVLMNINRKFKDSVFTALFGEPDALRELYCALEGVTLPPDTPVTVNSLEEAVFMERVNDISFEIGGKLVVLIEHQSTINPNMALRLLLYIGRVYEKIIDDRMIYSSKQMTIPRPEFYVLYNGVAPYPEEKMLRLTDMFENAESLGLPDRETSALELEVRVININKGQNGTIAERCRLLSEYSAFIAKVREYEKVGLKRNEAIKKAVIYCRDHDILKEFLEKNASEVLNMLFTEWNWDDAKEVWQEESREDEREKIARNMKNDGKPLNEIMKYTGIPIETIEKL